MSASASAGAKTLLLDGRKKIGAKILVSGGTRCNVTHRRVVPDAEGYRFLAVRFNAFAIDGRRFATVEAAREAARGALKAGNPG